VGGGGRPSKYFQTHHCRALPSSPGQLQAQQAWFVRSAEVRSAEAVGAPLSVNVDEELMKNWMCGASQTQMVTMQMGVGGHRFRSQRKAVLLTMIAGDRIQGWRTHSLKRV
jgi:hypothetical protein